MAAGLLLPLDAPAPGRRLLREDRLELREDAELNFHFTTSLQAEVEVFASSPRRIAAAKVRVLHHHIDARSAGAPLEPPLTSELIPGHAYVVSKAEGEAARAFDVDGHPMTDDARKQVTGSGLLDEHYLRTVLEGRELVVGQVIRHPTVIEHTTREDGGVRTLRYRDIEVVLSDVSEGIAHLEVSFITEVAYADGSSTTWSPRGWVDVATDGRGYRIEHLEGPIVRHSRNGQIRHGTARSDSKVQPVPAPEVGRGASS